MLPIRPVRLLPALLAAGALALPPAQASHEVASLADLSLEELADLEVTSVGKRTQRLSQVPGSVFVISQEDIRRSGATTLPEVLRLAPNLHVARADANQYAISARGFNSVLANKLLVLVDGRTVYSPLFSGVFWENVDVPLEDVERIEVLSGAGGTLYGSNAVNGVINVITRSALDTAGTLVRGVAGNREKLLAARTGGSTEQGLHWRLYGRRALQDASVAPTPDASRRSMAGFRADAIEGHDHLTVQGDLYQGEIDQAIAPRRLQGGNLLARFHRDHGGGDRLQLQAFVDLAHRHDPGKVDDRMVTWDFEFLRGQRLGGRHDLLWGGGWRQHDDRLVNLAPAELQFTPARRRLQLWNLFAQDDIALRPDLRLTLGLKAERNSYTGREWLPGARLAWQLRPQQMLWAAASRVVRTPSRADREVTTPLLPAGGSSFVSEVAQVWELGWRSQPLAAATWSLTLFHHDFERLRSMDLTAGGHGFRNSYRGRLQGLETWGRWRASERLRLDAGYTWQRLRLATRPGTSPAPESLPHLGNDPRSRLTLGVSWDLAPQMELDVHLRRIGRLPQPQVQAHTALDVRWGWRARPGLELSLAVRNLTDRRHAEWRDAATPGTELQRAVLLQAIWQY